ncbi:response regulator [Pseudomonas sp. BIGb0164]|uniref:response regulator n=1 Tax=Pseudomonas sp. BIGb0164 TaxID=2940605 RepID=UPI00216992E6|nr:response regulator [Pseudomonas sp. BIGb0164]MCS4246929.1 CheY-like chemotaxis protein [Pseudomonas sp. BIGb0164]
MPGHFSNRRSPTIAPEARVLVVDDHCTYRLLLGSLLEKLAVAYQCCCDGQQALHALATEHFDLVISDCRMPVMDGYTLTRELRRREQAAGRPPAIVLGLSGSLGPEEIRQCVACGMDGWLIKPIGFAQLREVLRCWLPPEPAGIVEREVGTVRTGRRSFPNRASLIDAFGSWDVVEPMLFSLIQEAHADLAVLVHAQADLDARLAAQCLHRLVGSVAFLGETGLEAGAADLIERVQLTGMALNRPVLDEFRHEVEWYLNYLAQL